MRGRRGCSRGSTRASASRKVLTSRAPAPTAGGGHDVAQPVAGGLLQAALGVADPAQLAGQAKLAEARTRNERVGSSTRAGEARGGHAAGWPGDREGDGEVNPGLVHAQTADHVDEHVGAARPTRPWRARIASTSASRLRSRPEATRRGCSSSEGATSAWTSTSSGREPSIAASITLPGARVACATKRAEASSTSTRPPWRISNSPASEVEPKRFFSAAQLAVRALALAFEVQHAVHHVLEHARARERAVLGDVPHEDRRDAARLGELHHAHRDLAHLAHRARGAEESSAAWSVCTESITHASGRVRAEHVEHRVEVGLGHDRHRQRAGAEPLGAQPHLLGGLLGADVQRAVARPARCPSTMLVSVDLPIPGAPPSSTSEPGTRPPPSTRSSSPMPVGRRATGAAPTSASGTGRAAAGLRTAAGVRHLPAARPPGPTGPPPARAPPRACSTPRSRGTARTTGPTEGRTQSRRERRRREAPSQTTARRGRLGRGKARPRARDPLPFSPRRPWLPRRGGVLRPATPPSTRLRRPRARRARPRAARRRRPRGGPRRGRHPSRPQATPRQHPRRRRRRGSSASWA